MMHKAVRIWSRAPPMPRLNAFLAIANQADLKLFSRAKFTVPRLHELSAAFPQIGISSRRTRPLVVVFIMIQLYCTFCLLLSHHSLKHCLPYAAWTCSNVEITSLFSEMVCISTNCLLHTQHIPLAH